MQLIKSKSVILHVYFTSNNILCTLTNLNGKSLFSFSSGMYKIKGLKKITTTTINSLIKNLYSKLKNQHIVYLRVKGYHKNKNDFLKNLKLTKWNILLIQENLCIPHGGCKQSKTRKI